MAENISNLVKEMNVHIQETPQTPSRMNSKVITSKCIIVKFLKVKVEKILKAVREKGHIT